MSRDSIVSQRISFFDILAGATTATMSTTTTTTTTTSTVASKSSLTSPIMSTGVGGGYDLFGLNSP